LYTIYRENMENVQIDDHDYEKAYHRAASKKKRRFEWKNSAISLNEGVEGLCKMWKEKKV
jgi:hypothetical protein